MTLNLEFLKCITEPIICSVDGRSVKYENGIKAEKFLRKDENKYGVQNITVEKGTIKVIIKDETEKIKAANRQWMKENAKRTGVEPSFF